MLTHLAQSACKSTQEAIQAAKQAIVQKEEEHSQVCKELQQLKGSSSLPLSWQEAGPEAVSTSIRRWKSLKGCCSLEKLIMPTCLLPCEVKQGKI